MPNDSDSFRSATLSSTPNRAMKPTRAHACRFGTRRAGKTRAIALLLLLVAAATVGPVFWDWWHCLPAQTTAHYVGGAACISCHEKEARLWHGSDHDRAMDRATDETVLGDFSDATLEHFGITSRMYRDGERFMIHTEGSDGKMADFEIEYVFGVDPLQQYMVEFDRPANMPDSEIARLQVLRVSWDTKEKRWFYLLPHDVHEKLAPDDLLHWTRMGQNWNHMCAECHSTDLRKNYDLATRTYHTTFSDIDVNCESCHGPGSTHVRLAEARSLFWDRKLGYGLFSYPADDPQFEIEVCAKCHARRRSIYPDFHAGQPFYDHYTNELLRPDTYYCDGQILDEDYVYGSFIQSKMYHKGIRCTDCHDAHSVRTKFPYTDNRLCVSCHTHSAGQLDAPAHHHHKAGSAGALCVECHMPESPYMDVDPRRDHNIRIPRPDLSIALGTPNACTKCHLDPERVDPEKRPQLKWYADWLAAARDGDEQVQAEIDRVDRWSQEFIEKWYGKKDQTEKHFAFALADAWAGRRDEAMPKLLEMARNRRLPAMVRASAVEQLGQFGGQKAIATSVRALNDDDPTVRAAAVANLQFLPRRDLLERIPPMLHDPTRLVRIEAARVLAEVPSDALMPEYREAFKTALDDFQAGMRANDDQAGAHMALALLFERMGRDRDALAAYENAIRVQPSVTGPRSNMAALLDRMAESAEQRNQTDRAGQLREQAKRYRNEAFEFLRRDAGLLPDSAIVQYRFGLALYMRGEEDEAARVLAKAAELEPNWPQPFYALAELHKKHGRWHEALQNAERLVKLRPENSTFQQLMAECFVRSQSTPKPSADKDER